MNKRSCRHGKHGKSFPAWLFAAAVAVLLASCASPSNPAAAGRGAFLRQVWITPELRQSRIDEVYRSVHIAPVDTSQLKRQGWWQNQSQRVQSGALERDAARLGAEFRAALAREIQVYPGNRLILVDQPGRGTLVMEMAITELVPSKAFWNAGAVAAGFVVPGTSLLSLAGSGSIAIEGRLRDGGSRKVVATFADRRGDLVSPVNLRALQWYAGSKANVDIWAKKWAEFLHAPPSREIRRTSWFTLRPW